MDEIESFTSKKETYWTVVARQSTRDTRGVGVEPGELLWLDMDDGYISWRSVCPKRGHFDSAGAALKTAESEPSGPWYCKPDLNTLRIVKITNTSQRCVVIEEDQNG